MCGIVAVVRNRRVVTEIDLTASIDGLAGLLDPVVDEASLEFAAQRLAEVNAALTAADAVVTLVRNPSQTVLIRERAAEVASRLSRFESSLDDGPGEVNEALNAVLGGVRDSLWAILRDRLRAVEQVSLLSTSKEVSELVAMHSLHQALSAIDRMEVRGRDSAGVELVVSGHTLDLDAEEVRKELGERATPLYTHRDVVVQDGRLAFVYKAAMEIGELGDNTALLRRAIIEDSLLHRALQGDTVHTLVLGHTRWASIGIISEANAHPVNSSEQGRDNTVVTAVLNGDVDNHEALATDASLCYSELITTDAKVIPTSIARRVDAGLPAPTAFREALNEMIGSVAIAANIGNTTDEVHAALRGSGQGIYVGIAQDCFLLASEPYGVVEETAHYLRLDGETASDADNPTGSRGQIITLRSDGAGTLEGLRRYSYDGSELPVREEEVVTAEITTRDIDRGEFPHFLLKELTDAPGSFRKTLRGKLRPVAGGWDVHLDDSVVPPAIRERLSSGEIRSVLVIGQGTAAVAGQSCAYLLNDLLSDTDMTAEALPATELSGFRLRANMSDTLVVAISQSGTTTDTNRTVDIVRSRGAGVIAIVNRRNSDLCDKADGVLYTSDGRDVEMSVASTKAFYSQIAAGILLAASLAGTVGSGKRVSDPSFQSLLDALAHLPTDLETVLAQREFIGKIASDFATSKRYWALVGNGPNQIAARELRIKMSELCYKSIACDATEDKKHIDLSAEPLILVCAAGLSGSTADDVSKEVAIFKAHKATPIVIATAGEGNFGAAAAVVEVPATDARLGFVLSAMAGHLFGYGAALAIDHQARMLREMRGAIESVLSAGGIEERDLLRQVRGAMLAPMQALQAELATGRLDGNLEASTAVRLTTIARFVIDGLNVDLYGRLFGIQGTPKRVVNDLLEALSDAIDQLTRPVDAIKHQAKTVTVGISRSDESLVTVPLVAALLESGTPRDAITYSTMRSLADLDVAVEAVLGFTRYAVANVSDDGGVINVVSMGGSSLGLQSRTAANPVLRGTKHLVAREQELFVSAGADGRNIVIVPEIVRGEVTGLNLLDLQLVDRLPAAAARAVMSGYRRRYQALRDAVLETQDSFEDAKLAELTLIELLTEPILDLARLWR